jgi:hypothetical protein
MPNKTYKNKREGIIEPTETDWAQLAAYLDGEGCISTSTAYSAARKWRSESVYVNVSLHNTDPRLIEWAVDRWGGRCWQTIQTNKKWTTAYGWRVTCQQARRVLENCLPHFHIKKEQAELAIALMKTQRRWGRNGMPQEVREQRWEIRNKLSGMKGGNSRIKKTKPRIIDYVNEQKYLGSDPVN